MGADQLVELLKQYRAGVGEAAEAEQRAAKRLNEHLSEIGRIEKQLPGLAEALDRSILRSSLLTVPVVEQPEEGRMSIGHALRWWRIGSDARLKNAVARHFELDPVRVKLVDSTRVLRDIREKWREAGVFDALDALSEAEKRAEKWRGQLPERRDAVIQARTTLFERHGRYMRLLDFMNGSAPMLQEVKVTRGFGVGEQVVYHAKWTPAEQEGEDPQKLDERIRLVREVIDEFRRKRGALAHIFRENERELTRLKDRHAQSVDRYEYKVWAEAGMKSLIGILTEIPAAIESAGASAIPTVLLAYYFPPSYDFPQLNEEYWSRYTSTKATVQRARAVAQRARLQVGRALRRGELGRLAAPPPTDKPQTAVDRAVRENRLGGSEDKPVFGPPLPPDESSDAGSEGDGSSNDSAEGASGKTERRLRRLAAEVDAAKRRNPIAANVTPAELAASDAALRGLESYGQGLAGAAEKQAHKIAYGIPAQSAVSGLVKALVGTDEKLQSPLHRAAMAAFKADDAIDVAGRSTKWWAPFTAFFQFAGAITKFDAAQADDAKKALGHQVDALKKLYPSRAGRRTFRGAVSNMFDSMKRQIGGDLSENLDDVKTGWKKTAITTLVTTGLGVGLEQWRTEEYFDALELEFEMMGATIDLIRSRSRRSINDQILMALQQELHRLLLLRARGRPQQLQTLVEKEVLCDGRSRLHLRFSGPVRKVDYTYVGGGGVTATATAEEGRETFTMPLKTPGSPDPDEVVVDERRLVVHAVPWAEEWNLLDGEPATPAYFDRENLAFAGHDPGHDMHHKLPLRWTPQERRSVVTLVYRGENPARRDVMRFTTGGGLAGKLTEVAYRIKHGWSSSGTTPAAVATARIPVELKPTFREDGERVTLQLNVSAPESDLAASGLGRRTMRILHAQLKHIIRKLRDYRYKGPAAGPENDGRIPLEAALGSSKWHAPEPYLTLEQP